MNVLIKSSARTGSHMLYDMFCAMGYDGYHTSWFFRDIDSQNRPRLASVSGEPNEEYLLHGLDGIVVHDHTNWVPNDPENWWIIYTKRCDVIAQALSQALAEHVKEYYVDGGVIGYTDKEYPPFEVDLFSILGKCKHRELWEKNLDRVFLDNNWRFRDVLTFESLVSKNPIDICFYLGLPSTDLPNDYTWETQKSPRNTRDMIINYDAAYDFCKRNL